MSSINAMTINRNWSTRPSDERYTSLTAMHDHMATLARNSVTKEVEVSKLRILARDGAVVMGGPNNDSVVDTTHWSFGQLCGEVGAAAAYLRKLPAELAAPCLQYGIDQQGDRHGSALLTKDFISGRVSLRALNSTTYGRIWNAAILRALIPYVGDGLTGPWKIPGEFGKRVEITKDNTTLYGSDRDMVIMLADEENRIELPNRRDGKTGSLARGFIVGNSEVGSGTAFIAWFLFDFLCCNRIIWGLQDVQEISIRHTSGGPARWLASAMPQVTAYAKASAKPVEQLLLAAQRMRVEDPAKLLTARFDFTKRQAQLIDLAHRHDERGRPMENVWDVVTGVTAYARTIEHQDSRMEVERKGGRILQMAA